MHMKSAVILLLLWSATALAAERVISTSPDGRFRVVVGIEDGPAFAIREVRSSDIVATDDSFAGGGGYGYSDTAASWSPDGNMVFVSVPHFHRSGPTVYGVLRWNGKQFTEVPLPKNAVFSVSSGA